MTIDFKKLIKNKYFVLNVLLILGMLDSAFLMYEHYAPAATSFCSFGEGVDCGIVNKSPYATLDGLSYLLTIDYGLPIPLIDIAGIHPILEFFTMNSTLGLITLLFIAFLLKLQKDKKDFKFIKHEKIDLYVRGILGFGIFYGMYLVYIQHWIIKTWCPFCLVLDALLITLFLVHWKMRGE